VDTVRASQLAFVPAQVHKLALDGTDQFRFSRLHGIFYRASQCSLAGFKLASINDLYKLPHAPLRLDLLYCIWLCEGCLSHSRLSLTVPSLSAAGTGYSYPLCTLCPAHVGYKKEGTCHERYDGARHRCLYKSVVGRVTWRPSLKDSYYKSQQAMCSCV